MITHFVNIQLECNLFRFIQIFPKYSVLACVKWYDFEVHLIFILVLVNIV